MNDRVEILQSDNDMDALIKDFNKTQDAKKKSTKKPFEQVKKPA